MAKFTAKQSARTAWAHLLLATGTLALLFGGNLMAQGGSAVSATATAVAGKRGDALPVKITVQVQSGLHLQSNAPKDPSLIPLRLTVDNPNWSFAELIFPQPKLEKYSFQEEPLSVFDGTFVIQAKVKASASAPAGFGVLPVKLRYQACSATTCYPPKTLDVRVPVDLK